MILTNIKPQNVTYVNGSEIASKRISINNTVELGKDRYRIGLPVVIDVAKKIAATPGPETYNISHLERIWNDYETEIDRIVKQQQDVAKKRMLPIMVGSLSGVASPLLATLVAVNTLYITVPVAAISFGLYFINYHKKDTSYEDRKAATERLTERYVCPNCHRFLGNISYKLLKNQIRSPKDKKCIVLDVDVSLLKNDYGTRSENRNNTSERNLSHCESSGARFFWHNVFSQS